MMFVHHNDTQRLKEDGFCYREPGEPMLLVGFDYVPPDHDTARWARVVRRWRGKHRD